MRTPLYGLLVIALAALTRTAGAIATIDAQVIREAAQAAVRAQAGRDASALLLQAAPLDPRLRLAACDQALQGFITGDGQLRSQTTVGVRCEGSVRWTIYTSVAVESQASVLVARRALPRDADVSAADFDVATRRVPGVIGNYVTDSAGLAGVRLRRALAAGEVLALEALAPVDLIHRGQQVVLLARAGGLEVRMAGIALSDGRASDRIRVQNLSSRRVVEGIVRSDNIVEAPL